MHLLMSLPIMHLLTLLLLDLCVLTQGQTGNILEYLVFEEEPANRFVGNVKVDAKLETRYAAAILNQLEFNFRYQTPMYALFTIDVNLGVIRTRQPIDRDEICTHQTSCDIDLDVKVTPVAYFEIVKVRVKIMDINDNLPTFDPQHVSTSVAETTNAGALIPIPSANDRDSGIYGIKGYRLGSDTPGSENFDLQVTEHSDASMDINIVLLNKLDREKMAVYALEIYAYDGDTPQHSGSVVVDITVTDANDNTPTFVNSTYETTIFENLPFRSTIIQVQATDPDSGLFGEVMYSFAPSTLAEHGNLFGINPQTGEIYVKGLIDYEQAQLYTLNVQAQDKGPNSLPTFTRVKIRVLDLNDHAPQINVNVLTTSGDAEVLENAEKGTFVAHVSVMDPDLGESGLFDCEIDNDAFQLLPLQDSRMEFKIVSRQVFDREQQAQYHIVLTCEDHGEPLQTAVTQILVKVVDENDHKPIFSKGHYYATIPENNSLNSYIIKVDASDRDSGRNAAIKYSIQGADNLVVIDSVSGVLKANIIFDYEQRNGYEFTVTATDHGNPPQSTTIGVSLAIEDQNDEYPVFDHESCFFTVAEGLRPSTVLGHVTATDADSRKYSNITYLLDPSRSGRDDFVMNEVTGELKTRIPLDREGQEVYHLEVIAGNTGFPDVQTRMECTIHVLDVNDNSPVIIIASPLSSSNQNNTFEISNLTPVGYVITKIGAEDPDSDNNGKVRFHISSSVETLDLFEINEITGDLSVASPLTDIEHRVIKLSVTAMDRGDPPKVTAGDISIVVDKSLASPLPPDSSFIQEHLMVILGALLGLIFIVVVITILLCAVRYRNRRQDKGAKYNCRLEANKALNGGVICRPGNCSDDTGVMDTPSYDDDDNVSVKSSDECSVDSPSKDTIKNSLKKEVTFTFDQDQAYMQKSPGGRSLTHETCLSDLSTPVKQPRRARPPNDLSPRRPDVSFRPDPTAQTPSPHRGNSPSTQQDTVPPMVGRGNKYTPHITDPRKYGHNPIGLRHYDRSPTHPGHTTLPGKKQNHLTEKSLEMHDILNLSNHTDMDSECSGTDSGRGPSEEGDNTMLYASTGGVPPHGAHSAVGVPAHSTHLSVGVPHIAHTSKGVTLPPHSTHSSTGVPSTHSSAGVPPHIPSPHSIAAGVPSSTQYAQSYRIDPYYAGPGESSNVKKPCSSQHPVARTNPEARTLTPPQGSTPTAKVGVPLVKPVPVRVNPRQTASPPRQPQPVGEAWDPLNHHPKTLDARDLMTLQTDLYSSPGGAGRGGNKSPGAPPPVPPKRDVSLRSYFNTDASSAGTGNKAGDCNGNYGNKQSGNHYGNGMYDVPSRLYTGDNYQSKNNPSAPSNSRYTTATNPALTTTNCLRPQPHNNHLYGNTPQNKKEVRFAEDCNHSYSPITTGVSSAVMAHKVVPVSDSCGHKVVPASASDSCGNSSNDGLSDTDDGTMTSGSYILDPSAAIGASDNREPSLGGPHKHNVYTGINITPSNYSVV